MCNRLKTFFNADIRRKKTIGTVRFKTTSPNQLGLPDLKPVSFPRSWNFLYYRNLDRKLVKAEAEGKNYPVVGYKRVGAGKIYFVGGDLLGYGFNKHRQDIGDLLNKLLTGSRTKHPPPVAAGVSVQQFTPNKMVFAYSADRPWPALISRTYSPHWRAYLAGGRRLTIVKTEGLMQINLPGGTHKVTLRYEPTAIHPPAKILTVIAWVFVGYMVIRWRKLDTRDIYGKKREEVSYL